MPSELPWMLRLRRRALRWYAQSPRRARLPRRGINQWQHRLVKEHRPMHVSPVGCEPLVRHRELSQILPVLSSMKVHTMVVTSAVGLPEHRDVRRKPASYERILKNIHGCRVNIHGTLTRQMLQRAGCIEEYI